METIHRASVTKAGVVAMTVVSNEHQTVEWALELRNSSQTLAMDWALTINSQVARCLAHKRDLRVSDSLQNTNTQETKGEKMGERYNIKPNKYDNKESANNSETTNRPGPDVTRHLGKTAVNGAGVRKP